MKSKLFSRREFIITGSRGLLAFGAGRSVAGQILASGDTVSFGVMTDSHYADRPPKEIRYYRDSIEKMQECIDSFNRLNFDFAFLERSFLLSFCFLVLKDQPESLEAIISFDYFVLPEHPCYVILII